MEIKSMKKMIEEIVGEQAGINEQISFARHQIQAIINEHPEIQSLNKQVSKLVRDSNVLTGEMNAYRRLIKIKEEELVAEKEKKGKKKTTKAK